MCIDNKELMIYRELNSYARMNSVVILGSTYMKDMPVAELKQGFGIISDIYNRSLTDLSVFEASDAASDIVKELLPRKLILQLGETDLMDGEHTSDEVISEYRNVIKAIRKVDKHQKIVLVSLNNLTDREVQADFNRSLEKLASETKSTYADISNIQQDDRTHIQAFRLLKFFMSDDIVLQLI